MGLELVMLEHIYAFQDAFSGTDAEYAEDLIKFYRDESVEVIYVTISYFLCCAGDITYWLHYMQLVNRNNALIETIDNLSRLNDKLRMDRHDYLNQLQIVYGLMELAFINSCGKYFIS